jgi:hypothetical protein
VPLSRLQSDILHLLARHRDPESYVAGSTPLNRHTPRFSGDIDVFHDREEGVARALEDDRALLLEQGFDLAWLRREPTFYSIMVRRGDEATKLEWVVDSDFRFFPAVRDELFGYMLHPVDIATNKIMAAAGRREPRDIVDLVMIHEQVLPLGAVVWAAVGKSLGFTPEGLINEVRRLARYTEEDFRRIASDPPVDPTATMISFRQAMDEAEAFVLRMPTDKVGLLFMEDGAVVQPDPDRLGDYATHAGRRRGHWPTSPEITAAMMERYGEQPEQDATRTGIPPGQRDR